MGYCIVNNFKKRKKYFQKKKKFLFFVYFFDVVGKKPFKKDILTAFYKIHLLKTF